MKKFFSSIQSFIDGLAEDNVPAYAAQVSFFVIVSALPLFTMLIPILRNFLPISEDDVISAVLSFMPSSSELQELVLSITQDVYTKSAGTVISISALSTMWAASKGIYALQLGLNRIAGAKETRLFIVRRIISIAYTIGFELILILSVGIMLFGAKIRLFFESLLPFLADLASVVRVVQTSFYFILFVLFFAVIYTTLPNRKPHFFRHFPGAVFSALGWMLFSGLYSVYISKIGSFSYLYGSLAALILLMLWLYFCMYIVFTGAEINKAFEKSLLLRREKKANKANTENIENVENTENAEA